MFEPNEAGREHEAMASSLVIRLLEELEVRGTTAGGLSLILLAILGGARALAALTVLFSTGHGPGL
jgi:hypothetical protein